VIAESNYSVIVAVNDDGVLERNLYLSDCIKEDSVQLQRGFSSAARALNAGMSVHDVDYFILVHQDVYLPDGWLNNLQKVIDKLSIEDSSWAVIGVAGVDMSGSLVGKLWSQGINQEIDIGDALAKVRSLDEVLLVLRQISGLKFDEEMAGFHLYGTDIVQQAKKLGYRS